MKMNIYTQDKLSKILELHRLFLENDPSGVQANLRGAILVDAILKGANLKVVNLKGANLEGATLEDANLFGANLVDANLKGANLKGANLVNANLKGANLKGANLEDADLRYATLMGVNLKEANLKDANLDYSGWPLWCGSFDAEVDRNMAAQLAYHFCRLDCDDHEYIRARNAIVKFANKFHRVGESRIPKIEEI